MAIVGPGGAKTAGEAIRGGADFVQIRAKALAANELMALVRSVVAEIGSAKRVIINSRPDIAELVGAFGVHLPEDGLDPASVRRSFPGLTISVSRHDRAGLDRAVRQGADFAILGPVFDTPGKETRALGIPALEAMVRGLDLPVLAVGGISPQEVMALTRAGVAGVAAIRPFENPEAGRLNALAFRAALEEAPGRLRPEI
jgi:thiamine-phosphate diphosphorylase